MKSLTVWIIVLMAAELTSTYHIEGDDERSDANEKEELKRENSRKDFIIQRVDAEVDSKEDAMHGGELQGGRGRTRRPTKMKTENLESN